MIVTTPIYEIFTLSSQTRNLIGIILSIMLIFLIFRVVYSLFMELRKTTIKKDLKNGQTEVIKRDTQRTSWIIVKSICFIFLIWGISSFFKIPLFFDSSTDQSQINIDTMDNNEVTNFTFLRHYF